MSRVTINEAEYIDPRAGNDKFYRTFVFDSFWVSQYGRNGTLGTFTKVVDAGSSEAAEKAANAKFTAKVKKGYNPTRSGQVSVSTIIDANDLSTLDDLAGQLVKGQSTTIVTEPVEICALVDQPVPSAMTEVVAALTQCPSRESTTHDLAPDLPVRPMLASVQSAQTIADAMVDPQWLAQFKYDGDRVVIEVVDAQIKVLNRQGQAKTKNVGRAHVEPFTALHTGRWVFDGEVVGRTLVLFDLATATDGDRTWITERSPFAQRYNALQEILRALGIQDCDAASQDAAVVLAPVAGTNEHKSDYLTMVVAQQREGIILRHKDGSYESGRRSTTLIKHKLIKDADVVITDLHATKSSATLSVHDASGNLVEVGAASTIGKGGVSVNDVWSVTFLYVTDPAFPRLYQPRLVSRREDKTAAECNLDQFVDAGTNRVV